MKRKAPLIALLCVITGCTTHKHKTCCAYAVNDKIHNSHQDTKKLTHEGNVLRYGEYWTRDANGNRIANSVMKPNAPRVERVDNR